MSRKNKLLIVLLSVIFCFSAFSFCAFAIGENGDEGGNSDVMSGDNQGGGSGDSSNVDIPPIDDGNSDSNTNDDNNGDNNGDNSGGNTDSGIDNGNDNGGNNGGYEDNNGDNGYSENGVDDGNDYNNYGDSDNNGYDWNDNGDNYQDYGESSYLGGGQTYVEPENIAPSASLYNSSGSVSEKTLNSGDWNDISEQLKNASNISDDADDFGFIQNNNDLSDNGDWMLIAGIVCFALSAAGILYFIVLTVQNKNKSKLAVAGVTGRDSKSSASRDYYGDGYKTHSSQKAKRSSKFDTAEVTLPKSSQGKRYKNNGRRYK